MRLRMELHHIRLIGFAAGALIVGLQTALIAKQWRKAHGVERRKVMECGLFCLITFFWQFGNLVDEAALAMNFTPANQAFRTTFFIRRAALYLIPLSLSYLSPLFEAQSGVSGRLSKLGQWLRVGLWPWSVTLILLQIAWSFGWVTDLKYITYATRTSVRLIPVFFVIFMIQSFHQIRESPLARHAQLHLANIAGMIACSVGIVVLVAADWVDSSVYVRIGTMLTLTTFAIAVAYRQYQFPFMDTFIRHATTALFLLSLLIAGVAAGLKWINPELLPPLFVIFAMGVLYVKEPVLRWVERALMGFNESVEDQENRIGTAIRALMRPAEFERWVAVFVPAELKAHWSELSAAPRPDAAVSFEVPGSEPLWLSVGLGVDGRPYMSRQLRLGQTTALQLAAQRERVSREEFERQQLISQHELREVTARAQIQALQAQIRPHFLFNTLNVLSNLIHTDARKAEDLTEELAAVFRYTLDATRMEWVSLEDEIRFVTSYLQIEKARFEGRLNYRIDLQPETEHMRIPPMILQPVVENAVRHGVSSRIEGGVVRLTAKSDAGRLVLVVEDSGKGIKSGETSDGRGIGLKNVRDRLKHIYRGQAAIQLSTVEPAGTRVVLTLPDLLESHV
jgi:hypothetical protein